MIGVELPRRDALSVSAGTKPRVRGSHHKAKGTRGGHSFGLTPRNRGGGTGFGSGACRFLPIRDREDILAIVGET